MQTPEELKAEIAELESQLAAAEQTAASAPEEIAELEAQEAAAEVAAPASPVVAPQPSLVKRMPITGQFYQGQQGCDSK